MKKEYLAPDLEIAKVKIYEQVSKLSVGSDSSEEDEGYGEIYD